MGPVYQTSCIEMGPLSQWYRIQMGMLFQKSCIKMGLLYQSSGIKMGHISEVSAGHPYPKIWEVTPWVNDRQKHACQKIKSLKIIILAKTGGVRNLQ